jgi:hypothetical protein
MPGTLAKCLHGHCGRVRTTHRPHHVSSDRDCPHTSLVCMSSISGLWERNTLRYCKQTRIGDTLGLCYIYRKSVRNGQVAYNSASAPFPRRGECPQVINVCQMYQSRECGLIGFVDCLQRRMVEKSLVGI